MSPEQLPCIVEIDIRLTLTLPPQTEIPPIIKELLELAKSETTTQVKVKTTVLPRLPIGNIQRPDSSLITRDMFYSFLLNRMDQPEPRRAKLQTILTYKQLERHLDLTFICCTCQKQKGTCRCDKNGLYYGYSKKEWLYHPLCHWDTIDNWYITQESLVNATDDLYLLSPTFRERVSAFLLHLQRTTAED